MEIVVDTSATIAVITNEQTRQALIDATAAAELIAPGSIRWEFGNALSAMIRRERATVRQAVTAARLFHLIPIREVDVDMISALELAARHNLYAYDAYMVQCAIEHHCPIITLDQGLRGVAVAERVPVVEY